MAHTYIKSKEYFRLQGKLYISETGLFKELPDEITDAYLEAQVVYYLVMVTQGGEFHVQTFANMPAQDKDKKIGGPVKFGADTLYTEAGPSVKELVLERVYNPYLSGAEIASFDAVWASLLATTQGGKWYA